MSLVIAAGAFFIYTLSSRFAYRGVMVMNRHKPLILIKCILSLLISVCLFNVVSAQKGTHVVKRVTFQRGSNSTVIKGKARWGASYIYLLRARAGQALTVHLEGVPVARIVPPGTENYEALAGADNVNDWSEKLPKTGEYQINVGHANDAYAAAPYTLEIKIE